MKNTFLKRRKPGKKIKVTRKSERNSHKWNGKIWITARKKKTRKNVEGEWRKQMKFSQVKMRKKCEVKEPTYIVPCRKIPKNHFI